VNALGEVNPSPIMRFSSDGSMMEQLMRTASSKCAARAGAARAWGSVQGQPHCLRFSSDGSMTEQLMSAVFRKCAVIGTGFRVGASARYAPERARRGGSHAHRAGHARAAAPGLPRQGLPFLVDVVNVLRQPECAAPKGHPEALPGEAGVDASPV